MENKNPAPPKGGVFGSILLFLVYMLIAIPLRFPFQGAAFYFVDSILRAGMGTAALYLFIKCFQKGKWTHVIHFRNFKAGLCAGSGIVLMTLSLMFKIAAGTKSVEVTPQLFFARIILQQLTTGFWEEMVFRAYLMEGYYSGLSLEERTWKKRLYYAFLSAFIFGAVHLIGSSSPLFSLIFTGAFGFMMAAAYLHSHNILVCMLLHFIYDILANFESCVTEWDVANQLAGWSSLIFRPLLGVGVLIAVVYIIKEPASETKEKDEVI